MGYVFNKIQELGWLGFFNGKDFIDFFNESINFTDKFNESFWDENNSEISIVGCSFADKISNICDDIIEAQIFSCDFL